MRLTGHLVGKTKRRISPNTSPHFITKTNKNTKAQGYMHDLRDELENKEGQSRSIYGSRGRAPTRVDDYHAGYTKYKSGWAEYN